MNPHGTFKIKVFNRIVVLHFEGGFNREGAVEFLDAFRHIVKLRSMPVWSSLALFGNEVFGTPDSEEIWQQYYLECEHLGMTHAAHINTNVVLKDQIEQLSSTRLLSKGYFDNLTDGVSWLKGKGFHIESNALSHVLLRAKVLINGLPDSPTFDSFPLHGHLDGNSLDAF